MKWKKKIKRKIKRYLNYRKELKILVVKAKENLNESEQYSCRNCLLLHWIKEESKKDKDDVIRKSLSEIRKILTGHILLENQIVAMASPFLS